MEKNGKSKTTRYVLLSCGVILVIACLCLGAVLLTGAGASLIWPIEFPGQPAACASPTPMSELPDQLASTISEIESQVIEIRGLKKSQSVTYTMISAEELEKIVVEDFFSEYSDEDARQDVLVLSSLGLLPKNFDLKGFYESLYSEQIAGFYDDQTKEIYVVQGKEFGGSEKLTYAHEFTHVLQDQVYDLEQGLGMSEEACEQDSERCAAVQALIEGDATQTEILWFQTHGSLKDYRDLMDLLDILETPVLDSAPPYMAADMYFSYDNGLAFVQFLYDKGNYEAVDKAFLDPPLSTEHILHPEKYPEDKPLEVTLPDLSQYLGDDWTLFDHNVMGEWYTYLILNKAYDENFQLTDSLSREAAEGWGGDGYAVYLHENTDETIFIMDTHWDTAGDAEEFRDAFEQYASERWESQSETFLGAGVWQGAEGEVAFWHQEDRTLWVMAPGDEILAMILEKLQ